MATADEVVELYAQAKKLKAEAEQLEAVAREKALELFKATGERAITSPIGAVTITEVAGARRFDKDLARRYLTAEQWESCHKLGSPTVKIQFFPKV